MKNSTIQRYSVLTLLAVSCCATGAIVEFDGVEYCSTPKILTWAEIEAGSNPGQPIGLLTDAYFREATGQFVLGSESASYNEVIFFDAPSSGNDFQVNAGGALTSFSLVRSMTEAPDGDVIMGKQGLDPTGQFDERVPYSVTDFSPDFTAAASASVSRGDRGKLDKQTDLFFVTTGASFVGTGEVGLKTFKLSDTSLSGDYDTVADGTEQSLPNYGESSNQMPGLAITPSRNIMVSDIHSGAYQLYSFTGLGDGDENGAFSLLETGDLNTIFGLSGGNAIVGASAIAFGRNVSGQDVLLVVDRGASSSDHLDDRVFFFAIPEPSTISIFLLGGVFFQKRRRK